MRIATKLLDNVIFRKDKIVEMCRGKSVLHLGFIQHAHLYQRKIEENDWLHSQIVEVASHAVGIDYLNDDVETIKAKYGYEAYSGDVTQLQTLELGSLFDVIVCGELIEHLENPGLMLEGIKKFMHSETILIITTPNPWSSERIRFAKNFYSEENWLNPEHTMWFSYQTLKQILGRTGYDPISCDYYYGQSKEHLFRRTNEGIIGRIRFFKRVMCLLLTPKSQYDGLFFIAKLSNDQRN